MAVPYEQQTQDDEENQKGEPKQLGTESAIIQQEAPSGAAPSTSGQFTNLQSYLTANAGAHQGEKLAGQVGQSITGAQQASQNAQSGFQAAVDKGSVTPDERVFDDVRNNPVGVANNADEAAQFKAIRDAQYKGPTDFTRDSSDYTNAYDATQRAQQQANASKTESGRFGLLQQYYNRPDYTSGQQKLDQFLVANDPNSQGAFQNVQQQSEQLQPNFQNLTNSLNSYAQNAQQTTEDASKRAKDLLGVDAQGNLTQSGLIQDLQSDITGRFNAANTDYTTRGQSLTDVLNNTDLSQAQIEQLGQYGLTPGMKTFGVNPNSESYLTRGAAPTVSTVATSDDVAKLNALSDLSGRQNDFLTAPEQAGTYNPENAAKFNSEKYLNDIKGQKANYDEALNRRIFTNTTQGPNLSGFNNINDLASALGVTLPNAMDQPYLAPLVQGGSLQQNYDAAQPWATEQENYYNQHPEYGQIYGNLNNYLNAANAPKAAQYQDLKALYQAVGNKYHASDTLGRYSGSSARGNIPAGRI